MAFFNASVSGVPVAAPAKGVSTCSAQAVATQQRNPRLHVKSGNLQRSKMIFR
jgi:hypothetical protein